MVFVKSMRDKIKCKRKALFHDLRSGHVRVKLSGLTICKLPASVPSMFNDITNQKFSGIHYQPMVSSCPKQSFSFIQEVYHLP
jgi:hypothetical protein